jgi:hypothetical protein
MTKIPQRPMTRATISPNSAHNNNSRKLRREPTRPTGSPRFTTTHNNNSRKLVDPPKSNLKTDQKKPNNNNSQPDYKH